MALSATYKVNSKITTVWKGNILEVQNPLIVGNIDHYKNQEEIFKILITWYEILIYNTEPLSNQSV